MPVVNALPDDAAALTALVNSAYRGETALQGWTTESHLLDGQRIDEEAMREYFKNPAVTLLKYVDEAGELAGSVYLEKVKDNRLYLGMLTVRPDRQARGIGKALLTAADAQARQAGCTSIRITVISLRQELIAWYKRRGYDFTGETVAFPTDTRFGAPRRPLQLSVMEKPLG